MAASSRAARVRIEGDVDRHVVDLALAGGPAPGLEQIAGLGRRAGAQLDDGDLASQLADLVRPCGEDLALGSGEIVLRLFGDPREDPAALLVVKVAAVEPAGVIGEPARDRVGECVVGRRGSVEVDGPALPALKGDAASVER